MTLYESIKADLMVARANGQNVDDAAIALEEMRREERIAREMLWIAHSKCAGYGDDGEMQFGVLDYKRQSFSDIRDYWVRKNLEECAKGGDAPRPSDPNPITEGRSDAPALAEQDGAGASSKCPCGCNYPDHFRDTAMRYHGIPLTPPVTWPCECAGRKAIRLFLSGLATASLGRHIYFLKDRSGLEAALSAPCPCDALREERDRYMTLAEVREIKADRLRVENMRLKSQLAAAVEAHRQAEAECDTAIRTRNLAQAASTRDLEAKRAAEVTLISCAGENDQLRADLATAAQGTIKALDT